MPEAIGRIKCLNFLKSRQYYHRLGRIWKRSYHMLYGPAGTGKSTFVAAMAKFLSYDIYEINLHKVRNGADLKYLLLQTMKKSVLVIEDLDRHLEAKSTALSLSGVLNFMDGIFSSCDEESEQQGKCRRVDPTPRENRFHINFPLCDFTAFKNLANSHLGLKEHKLFSQIGVVRWISGSHVSIKFGEIRPRLQNEKKSKVEYLPR